MNKPRRKISLYVIVVLFIGAVAFLFFNEDGVIKYIRLKNQIKDLKSQTAEVEQENKRLEGEIDSLQKKVPAKVERAAREKYNMIREGETTIKVVEE